jgi:hypothetical protein
MKRYGCHNKPREAGPLLVQDGYVDMNVAEHMSKDGRYIPRQAVRLAVVRDHPVPFDVSTCKHDKRLTDPGCKDCEHARKPE